MEKEEEEMTVDISNMADLERIVKLLSSDQLGVRREICGHGFLSPLQLLTTLLAVSLTQVRSWARQQCTTTATRRRCGSGSSSLETVSGNRAVDDNDWTEGGGNRSKLEADIVSRLGGSHGEGGLKCEKVSHNSESSNGSS